MMSRQGMSPRKAWNGLMIGLASAVGRRAARRCRMPCRQVHYYIGRSFPILYRKRRDPLVANEPLVG